MDHHMITLGLDSSKDGFFYVLVQTLGAETSVLMTSRATMPANMERAASLAWLGQEIEEITREYQIVAAVIKKAEWARTPTRATLERAEVDGVIQAALHNAGVTSRTVPWATLARSQGTTKREDAMVQVAASPLAAGMAKNRHIALAAALMGTGRA
jgi:Holliday junction resolvasome RuvABC endonuclease subunit